MQKNVNKEPLHTLILWTCACDMCPQSSCYRISHPGVLQLYRLDAGAHNIYRVLGWAHVLTVRMRVLSQIETLLKLLTLMTFDTFNTTSTTAQHLSQSLHPWALDGLSAQKHQRSLHGFPRQAKAWKAWKIHPSSPFSQFSLSFWLLNHDSRHKCCNLLGLSQIQTSSNASSGRPSPLPQAHVASLPAFRKGKLKVVRVKTYEDMLHRVTQSFLRKQPKQGNFWTHERFASKRTEKITGSHDSRDRNLLNWKRFSCNMYQSYESMLHPCLVFKDLFK